MSFGERGRFFGFLFGFEGVCLCIAGGYRGSTLGICILLLDWVGILQRLEELQYSVSDREEEIFRIDHKAEHPALSQGIMSYKALMLMAKGIHPACSVQSTYSTPLQ